MFEYEGQEQRQKSEVNYPQLQQQFCERAERFIADNRQRPFFLELALSAPHLPNFPAPAFAGKSHSAAAYGDSVMEVDSIVGRVLAALKTHGLDGDTLVIFTSDNGPWFEGTTGGMRNRKGGAGYDGGYRVPFVARWPGRIPAGARCDSIAMGIDIFPTLCAFAQIPPPPGSNLDGKDISAVLTKGAPSPHDALILFQNEEVVAVRTQKWKYVNSDLYMSYFMYLEGRGYPQLYDMRDPTEQYSVASLHTDVVKMLQSRMAAAENEFARYRRPGARPLNRIGPNPEKVITPDIWKD